ncbi:tyrosine-type recombinase/integrase [Xanthobacter versatilis]|uniref:tyrosine-type recombinase/integrase n=1 Tax=Xanthobacter autotrophicus (strain ATCC BAA-1158 / Py2) TaxID=78245 RepID=UPI0037262903
MKRKGKHPDKALTAVAVRQAKTPGRHADGNGLYLEVDASGAKRWTLRIIVKGRRRDIGLGGVTLVSLSEAREKALAYRKIAREGGDPLLERRKAQGTIPTFAEAAEKVHGEHAPAWKNEKHAAQWLTTLKTYAYPEIGELPINAIDTPMLLKVLSPIWLSKPETARRLRQRLGTVFDWAKAAGYREGDNPIEGVERGLPKNNKLKEHHAALPYGEVPAFVTAMRSIDAGLPVRLGFEFLILTAARTGEVIGATWDEIDLAEKVWTVPAARMKAKRAHRVPLSERCMEILGEARRLGNEGYVFPGRSSEKPLSNMAFLMVLRRMEFNVTAHGFRSAFRDWAAEATNHPREVCEMALAHTVENKVEAAYRRGDLFEKRRQLMADWTAFVAIEKKGDDSNPISRPTSAHPPESQPY